MINLIIISNHLTVLIKAAHRLNVEAKFKIKIPDRPHKCKEALSLSPDLSLLMGKIRISLGCINVLLQI